MKKKILFISFLMFSSAYLIAQVQTTPDNPNAPIISFEKVVHDYGKIEKGSDGICYFKFTNKGKEPLILTNARASCGCTVPSWPKEPIPPNGTGEIKVKYNTNRVGKFQKTITIISNAKSQYDVLTIKGEVIAPTVPEQKPNNLAPKAH